jgi:hypothetical protein
MREKFAKTNVNQVLGAEMKLVETSSGQSGKQIQARDVSRTDVNLEA